MDFGALIPIFQSVAVAELGFKGIVTIAGLVHNNNYKLSLSFINLQSS